MVFYTWLDILQRYANSLVRVGDSTHIFPEVPEDIAKANGTLANLFPSYFFNKGEPTLGKGTRGGGSRGRYAKNVVNITS